MSLAYFPLFPTDFDADTGHLTLAEDGAYNRLLRLSWRCPEAKMPNDIEWIYRKARAVTDEDKAIVSAVIAEFFTRKGGKIYQQRLAKIWVEANEGHARRVRAGKSGGIAKAAKTKNNAPSNATEMPEQCSSNQNQNQNHIEEKREPIGSHKAEPLPLFPQKPPQKRKVGLPDEWVPSDRNIEDALRLNFSAEEVEHEAVKFRDYHLAHGSVFKDWNAAWRTWLGNARKFASRGMAGATQAGGRGQGSSLASIAARRHLGG